MPDRVVLHFLDGHLLKGELTRFSSEEDRCEVLQEGQLSATEVMLSALKAIYYVKSYSGNNRYREKRRFGLSSAKGKRVMVRFKDGEILCGHLNQDLPWKPGGGLTGMDPTQKGFFLYPSDPNSNNLQVFVITATVADIRRL
jgi:hypothetical protein